MKLYEDSGWINWQGIIDVNEPFTFCYGGRGCGKTYGILKNILTDPEKPKFVFMRRTQKQLNTVSIDGLSPFIKLRNDLNIDLKIKASSKTETTSILIDDEERGVGIALSTVSNLRGFDSEAKYLIYDEFIPDPSERRTIKMEGFAFMNVVETLARNRELLSDDALKVAKINADKHGVSITFIKSDLLENIEAGYDIIVSNPPYIKTSVIDGLDDIVKNHEPYIALNGGTDGLDFYKRIVADAKKCLKLQGRLIMEIGYDQGEDLRNLLKEAGYSDIKIIKDLSGNDRVAMAVFGG